MKSIFEDYPNFNRVGHDPINMIAYDITDGTSLYLQNPDKAHWKDLVFKKLIEYRETSHFTRREVYDRMELWFAVVDGDISVVPRSYS